jgi:hypothetical protein
MHKMLTILLAFTSLITSTFVASFADESQWKLLTKNGHPYLLGSAKDYEGDTDFWALCVGKRVIEIGVGANSQAGTGKSEPITLMLKSSNRSARVTGHSEQSANFQMTGGTELRASISARSPIFTILQTGKPIHVEGSIQAPADWRVEGLKPLVRAFLNACKD